RRHGTRGEPQRGPARDRARRRRTGRRQGRRRSGRRHRRAAGWRLHPAPWQEEPRGRARHPGLSRRMPFTPAHAVIALPFLRTPLLPAAIAVGAMTPDLPLFVRGTPLTYHLTHTNVLLTALIALVLLLVWWAVLRPAVRELSPRRLAARLPREW